MDDLDFGSAGRTLAYFSIINEHDNDLIDAVNFLSSNNNHITVLNEIMFLRCALTQMIIKDYMTSPDEVIKNFNKFLDDNKNDIYLQGPSAFTKERLNNRIVTYLSMIQKDSDKMLYDMLEQLNLYISVPYTIKMSPEYINLSQQIFPQVMKYHIGLVFGFTKNSNLVKKTSNAGCTSTIACIGLISVVAITALI